ncbi:MAG: hypothetical protein C3F11_11635 [Methylocystaceae bacterium]|nr:MAG: hypothetical protein C3F11_11635 [Methylocystaceae bacterium]
MLTQIDRQMVRSWYRRSVGPLLAELTGKRSHRTGPRIAVVGNCQSFGVAYAMQLLDPLASVDRFAVHMKAHVDVERLAKTLSGYDYVFSHEFQSGLLTCGDSGDLRRLLPKAIFFPFFWFPAYHPDQIHLLDETRGNAGVFGPLGPYHSALALFAFRKGLTLDEANALFNENVFDEVGYFDAWNAAVAELVDNAAKYSLDLREHVVRWSRRGVFMWSNNHPKSFVLYDLAKTLTARAGLPVRDVDWDYYAIDDLGRSDVFPVYPPLAERFGHPGSYTFKRGNYRLSSSVGDSLTLPQFLAGSYKLYGRSAPSQISNPRVENWLADVTVGDKLVALARENSKAGLTHVR